MAQVQLTLFDEIDDPKNTLLKCWIGRKKEWINEYTKNNLSVKNLEQILKSGNGVGGFSFPEKKPNYVHWGAYNNKGVELEGTDSNGVIKKVEFTWPEAAREIIEMIKKGTW